MLRKLGLAIYRGVFWTYERGSWQYDIMCVLIVAFILFTPRDWFHDRPLATPSASDVVLLRDDKSQKVYQLRADLIDKKDSTVELGALRVLRSFTGRPLEITRIEPAVDSHGQVISYAVWVRE